LIYSCMVLYCMVAMWTLSSSVAVLLYSLSVSLLWHSLWESMSLFSLLLPGLKLMTVRSVTYRSPFQGPVLFSRGENC
jgi:hypothetical protein